MLRSNYNLPIAATTSGWLNFTLFDMWLAIAFIVSGVVAVLLATTWFDPKNYVEFKENDDFEMVLTLGTTVLIFIFWVMNMGGLHGLKVLSRKVKAGHIIDMTGNQWFWDCEGDTGFSFKNGWNLEPSEGSYFLKLKVTSNDVLHSVGMRGLGTLDAVPGRVKEAAFKVTNGVFSGNCMELCGVGHSHMPFTLIV